MEIMKIEDLEVNEVYHFKNKHYDIIGIFVNYDTNRKVIRFKTISSVDNKWDSEIFELSERDIKYKSEYTFTLTKIS